MIKRRHPYKLELIHWEEKLNRQILMVYFVHFMDNRVKNVWMKFPKSFMVFGPESHAGNKDSSLPIKYKISWPTLDTHIPGTKATNSHRLFSGESMECIWKPLSQINHCVIIIKTSYFNRFNVPIENSASEWPVLAASIRHDYNDAAAVLFVPTYLPNKPIPSHIITFYKLLGFSKPGHSMPTANDRQGERGERKGQREGVLKI